jgi:hypothetical protein
LTGKEVLKSIQQIVSGVNVNTTSFGYNKELPVTFSTGITNMAYPEFEKWPMSGQEEKDRGRDLGVCFADFNGNGLMDIIKADGNNIEVWTNSTQGWSRVPAVTVPDGGIQLKGVTSGVPAIYTMNLWDFDVDQDGKKDLLDTVGVEITRTNNPGGRYEEIIKERLYPWYRREGGGSFEEFVAQAPKDKNWKMLYDNDYWNMGYRNSTYFKGIYKKWIGTGADRRETIDLYEMDSGRVWGYFQRGSVGQTVGWKYSSTLNAETRDLILRGGVIDSGFRLIDLNGDGLIDVIKARDGQAFAAYTNKGSGWVAAPSGFNFPVHVTTAAGNVRQDVALVDVDGDGLTDIIAGNDVYISTGRGFVKSGTRVFPSVAIPFPQNKQDSGIRFADINNDGLTDVIRLHVRSYGAVDQTLVKKVYINNGTSWVERGFAFPGDLTLWNMAFSVEEIEGESYEHHISAECGDINGDGYSDLFCLSMGYNRKPLINVNGASLQYKDAIGSAAGAGLFRYKNHDYGDHIIDLDGDGCSDVVLNGGRIIGMNQYKPGSQLTNIENGIGGRYLISYRAMSNAHRMPFRKRVVERVLQVDEVAETSVMTMYDFKEGRYEREENAFLGFKTVKAVDAHGSVEETWYHNESYVLAGRPYRTIQRDAGGNVLKMETTLWNVIDLFGKKVQTAVPVQITAYRYDGMNSEPLSSSEKVIEYKNYGLDGIYPWKEVVTQKDRTAETVVTLVLRTVNGVRGYLPEFFESRINGNVIEQKSTTYDNLGRPTVEEVKDLEKGSWLSSTVVYNPHGNIQSKSDHRGNEIRYEYDPVVHECHPSLKTTQGPSLITTHPSPIYKYPTTSFMSSLLG